MYHWDCPNNGHRGPLLILQFIGSDFPFTLKMLVYFEDVGLDWLVSAAAEPGFDSGWSTPVFYIGCSVLPGPTLEWPIPE